MAVRRALLSPWRASSLTPSERTVIEEEGSGRAVILTALCGFVPHGEPRQRDPVDDGPPMNEEEEEDSITYDNFGQEGRRRVLLACAPARRTSDVALLRSIGGTLERARLTPSEEAWGVAPRLRAPLMRCPPSFGGLASATTPLLTDFEALANRAAVTLRLEPGAKVAPKDQFGLECEAEAVCVPTGSSTSRMQSSTTKADEDALSSAAWATQVSPQLGVVPRTEWERDELHVLL